MSNNKSDFDNELQNTYQDFKAENRLSGSQKEALFEGIEQVSHNTQDTVQHGFLSHYRRFSYVKPLILCSIALVLIVPIFSLIKEQTQIIKPAPDIMAEVHFEEYLVSDDEATPARLAITLPQLPMSTRPEIILTEIAASTPEQKLSNFNQLIENLKQQAVSATQLAGLDFADELRQGRLVQLDGDWFIEFCDERRELLRNEVIEHSLLAANQKQQSDMTFDVYSNQNGVIALLQNSQPLMCD
ncbi:hypothetical protein FE810_12290 [Thalassotalea litorea]|uniref:Uncharacterized protein n=1 Tax=Thalassotalea litorea TaxID=2020715 RepID=A0A5R9IEX8_9GAMM|nr:hypothetical protein [Thalassotalea litorea]TLU64085.1 hypothetical protein FE810_12290 [Thalassotalea litorea]